MRKEIRYKINYMEYQNIMQLLKLVMAKDKNAKDDGTYKIKTMYFDNYHKEVQINKKHDINSVYKYRIRMYNNDTTNIFLERKTNENGYIKKQKEKIEEQAVRNIMEGNYKQILEEKPSLKTELYLNMNLKQLRPSFILEYERIAFSDDISKARITIDKNVKSTLNCYKFFEKLDGANSEKYILEIKYESYLPEYIKNIITSIEGKQIEKSKFKNETKKWGY